MSPSSRTLANCMTLPGCAQPRNLTGLRPRGNRCNWPKCDCRSILALPTGNHQRAGSDTSCRPGTPAARPNAPGTPRHSGRNRPGTTPKRCPAYRIAPKRWAVSHPPRASSRPRSSNTTRTSRIPPRNRRRNTCWRCRPDTRTLIAVRLVSDRCAPPRALREVPTAAYRTPVRRSNRRTRPAVIRL